MCAVLQELVSRKVRDTAVPMGNTIYKSSLFFDYLRIQIEATFNRAKRIA